MFHFNSHNFKQLKEKSFTLLEVMMAIFVLTLAVGASYVLIQKTFIASAITQSKLVAYYFAQEGVENIRNARDTNWLNSAPDWADGITGEKFESLYFLNGTKSKFERRTYVTVDAENKEMEVKVPIVVRLEGTKAEEAAELLDQSDLHFDWYIEPEEEPYTQTCGEWCVANYPNYYEDWKCVPPDAIGVCNNNQAIGEQLDCDAGLVCFCCYSY